MATLSIPRENRQLASVAEIRQYLAPFGIWYEKWDVAGRIDQDATSEQILAAYEPEIARLRAKGGYVTADVIDVNPATPNLNAMLNRFNKEHTHIEDEVRFIVKGRGLFHIHPQVGPVFAITVEAGDLINVPAGTRHWFDLCKEDRIIRAIRLFLDKSGWTPTYVDENAAQQYEPVCWGPNFIPVEKLSAPVSSLKI